MLVDSKILALVSSLTWAAPLTWLDRPGHDRTYYWCPSARVHPSELPPRSKSPTRKTSTCGEVLDKFTDALQTFPVIWTLLQLVNVLILGEARPVATEIIKSILSRCMKE
jgi:hypothetical protein